VTVSSRHVERTERIGVDYAGEWAKAPLRFVDRRSKHLSR
jgi:3-methyladenine DNA glycosylase Mpg